MASPDIWQTVLSEHRRAVEGFLTRHASDFDLLAKRMTDALRAGNKILFCGNGGSACDAMHIAGEFVGRFVRERRGLPAIALSADSGILTAVGNDYGFEQIFARQVEALAQQGDVLIALSTSGKSPNILAALLAARAKKCFTVLMTGEKGTAQQDKADLLLAVPHAETARIQEAHLMVLHTLAHVTEQALAA